MNDYNQLYVLLLIVSIMKKSLFMMGMAALALASCTNEEVVNIPSSKAIGFDAFVGNTTKVAIVSPVDLDALKAGDGFYVFGGYEKVPDVFANTNVKWNSSAWAYSPLNYWKVDEMYKFAAYAPAINVVPTFSYETGALTFTGVQSDMANQKDFIVAQIKDPITGLAENNQPISFTFRHALSMIKIKLTNGFREGVKVNVNNDFKIEGINTKGNFVTTFGSAGTWSEVNTPAVFTDEGTLLSQNGQVYEPEFIVIPQKVDADAVTVSFSVTLTDEKDQPVPVDGGTGAGQNVKTFTIKVPAGTWANQNRYSYSLTIDGALFGLETITFGDPTIEDWGGYGDTPVQPE